MSKLTKDEKKNLKIAIETIDSRFCLFHRMVYQSNRSFLVSIPADTNFEKKYSEISEILGNALYSFSPLCTVGGNFMVIEVKNLQ